jgi:hypothetical protein
VCDTCSFTTPNLFCKYGKAAANSMTVIVKGWKVGSPSWKVSRGNSVSIVTGYWLNNLCLIQCRGRGFIFNTMSGRASGTASGYWPQHPYWLLDSSRVAYWPKHPYWLLDPSRVAYWPKRSYWLWDQLDLQFLPACLSMELKRSEHATEYFLHVVTKLRKLEPIFPHCHMPPRCDFWLDTVKSHAM